MPSHPTTEFEDNVRVDPDAEKVEETQNEYRTGKAGNEPSFEDDAHTRAVTRKLLFKLDTR